MTIQHFGADPARPLSSAVRAGDWLYVSGQASTDPASGEFLPGTFDEEFARSTSNLLRVLAESGASYEQVVKISGFVRDEQDLPRYNELYLARFPHPRPARTTLAMGFQFLRVELEAIAYLGR
jgi:2-iminobutanoate/2-iminopropanoate deaminase